MGKQETATIKLLREALDPFDRILSIIEALPGGCPVKPQDEWDTGIRDYMPRVWPTFSDLRKVRAALKEAGE